MVAPDIVAVTRSRGLEARVIGRLEQRADEIGLQMLRRLQEEVPRYAAVPDDGFAADVLAHCRRQVRAFATAARGRRPLEGGELAFVREQAAAGAARGVPLESLLHAYRVGHRVLWEAIMAESGAQTPAGIRAALSLTGRTIAHVDLITTTCRESYPAAAGPHLAPSEGAARELIDDALAGRVALGELGSPRARAAGFETQGPFAVVAAGVRGDDGPEIPSSVARAIGEEARTRSLTSVAAVRGEEVVAFVVLPGGAVGVAGLVRDALRRLGPGVVPAAAGIGLPCADLGEAGRGYGEARWALGQARRAGEVVGLSEMPLVDYLLRRADETAARIVAPQIRGFVEGDLRQGGVLVRTLLAFLDCDLEVGRTAKRLLVHPNTVRYRLRRIAELSGRRPDRFGDLVELRAAVGLIDGPRPALPPPRSPVGRGGARRRRAQ